MKKSTKFTLKSLTEIKIFLLFLLDNIRYPIDYTTLSKIISENARQKGHRVMENNLNYTRNGDYLIPNLTLNETQKP